MISLIRRRPSASRAPVIVLAFLSACSLNAKPEKTTAMAKTGVTASVEGLRSAVLGQSQDASEAIERAADTIAAQATSPTVRVNALEWKLVSATELQSAALARDPVVALADLIVFTLQMRAFLTTGEGRDLFGPQQPAAVATTDGNLSRLLILVKQITPSGTSERWLAVLSPYAESNPIQSPYVGRVGATDSVGQALSADRSALAAVGDIDVTARILDLRIEQIQRSLLKQARWQAELMVAYAAKQPVVDTLVRDVDRITSSVERITGVTEELPDLVTRERIAALEAVTQERLAVLAGITGEREAVLSALSAERAIVIDALHEERIATLKDAELAAQRLVDFTLERRLVLFVNKVLWRVFVGLVVLILLAVGGALVVVSAARRRGGLSSA